MLGISSASKDVGSIGVSAIIVFIAMVLVAGVATTVLVQSANRLESQAMASGQDTICELASALKIDGVCGYSPSAANTITRLAITVSLRPGSNGVNLSHTFLEISNSIVNNILKYGNILIKATAVNGGLFGTSTAWIGASATRFNIIVIRDTDGSCTESIPVLNFGDAVVLTVSASSVYNVNGGITPDTDIYCYLTAAEGVPCTVKFRTPKVYVDEVMELM